MAEEPTDVLMRIVHKKAALKGESSTSFVASVMADTLRKDFLPGFFCELREFSFSAGVSSKASKAKKKQKEVANALAKQSAEKRVITEEDRRQMILRGQDKKFRKRHKEEVIDMQPVEFTRVLDSSSTLLFKSMVDCDTLDSISVVKRKPTGGSNSGLCYLRMDFKNVLITNLVWKDEDQGHVMVETGTFIYRSVLIRYRKQMSNGLLGPEIPAEWTMTSA